MTTARRSIPQSPPSTPQTRGLVTAGALVHDKPAWSRSPVFRQFSRPDNDELATAQTVMAMSALASKDAKSAAIRAAAAEAVGSATSPDEILQRVFTWVKSRVRFRSDQRTALLSGLPHAADTELLIRPVDLISMDNPAGDCDDFAMLTLALLHAVGIPAEIVTINADPTTPNYTHVFVAARIGDRSVAMDTSHGSAPGWQARAVGKSRTWRIVHSSGMGAVAPWVQEILKTGASGGMDILQKRYGQAPAGVYEQVGPDGSRVYYRQNENASALQFPGAAVNLGDSSSTLMLLGIGFVALLAFGSKR